VAATAVKATAGTILTYRGVVALTQFAPSNGGHSAQGDFPYLAPQRDPYDRVIKSQAWTRTLSASSISRVWPSVGTVKRLQISSRDGAGAWGGRVKTIKIIGSSRTATVSGTTFQRMFGLRSRSTRSPAVRPRHDRTCRNVVWTYSATGA
jgi:stage II sporulation protein D